MGGSHHNHKAMNNGSRSGKPYGLMLLLAFGAALLGVMVLHKLRERRIFSLLVKEKDAQLVNLQFLLQKEKEYGKEMKRKTKEMKEKIYSLRTQKMELDRRLIEMQSTIDSLKDEQKVIETALEEKQNEIKMHTEEIHSSKEDSELIDLNEILKQKQAEIEDLKLRLEYPVKVRSVTSDDLSNLPVNLKNTSSVPEKDKTDTSSSKENGGELHESTNFVDGENSTRVEARGEKSVGDTNSREMTVEHLRKLEISQDEAFRNGDVIEGKAIDQGKEELKKLRDNSTDVKDGIDRTITREREFEKLQNSQEDEKPDAQAISKGGIKLEMLDSRIDAGSRLRGKHGHVSRTKGKRWRALAKNRVSENNGLARMRSGRIYRLNQDELRSKRDSRDPNERMENMGENPVGVQETVDSADAKLLKVNPEDAEYMKNRHENADLNQPMLQDNEMSKKSHNSPVREVFRNRSVNDEAVNISNNAEKQRSDEVRQPEEEASGIQGKLTSRDNNEEENTVKYGDRHQITNDLKVPDTPDTQESEAETTTGGSSWESTSNLEEDKEEYKEEIDESAF